MTKYIGPKTDGENVATQADKLSLSSDNPDALTPDQSGAAGTALTAARADHQHEITAGIAGTILPDATAGEGSSTSFSRADHTHAIAAASASTITGVSSSEGTSTSFSRADHTHAISLPRCRALRTSNQSIANNDLTTFVQFDAADDFDTDGFHDPSSNNTRITIPSGLGGIYIITAFIRFAAVNTTGNRQALLALNGSFTDIESGASTAGFATNATRISLSAVRSLSASDYLELLAFQTSGSALNLSAASIEIVRIA